MAVDLTLEKLRFDFLTDLDFITNLGSKMFLCPFIGRSKRKLLCYYFIYFLHIITMVQLVFTLILNGTDALEIINIAPNIGACLMSTIKYATLHTHREFYHNTFKHFREDIWALVSNNSKENLLVVMKYKNISKFINTCLSYIVVVLVVIIDSFPFVVMTYENQFLGKDLQFLYPFDAVYPFDKVKWYAVAYVWESVMTAIVLCMFLMANVVNLSLVVYICMELILLGNWLEGLISDEDVSKITKQRRTKETHEKIKSNLKFIIKRHNFLNEISSGLDEILGDLMFISYTFGTVFICLTAFSCTVVDDLYKSLRYFSFFASLLLEMFNQCMVGQVLSDHSEAVTQMIYSSNWFYADNETKRDLLLLMMRTQKPFKLTAKGYITMNLNTLSEICSTSYKFFNLLVTIYHP